MGPVTISMEALVISRPTENQRSGLQQVLEVALNPDKQWAIFTASRPWTTAAEQQMDNAILRQELRAMGLSYWLLFGEWRERPDLPTGNWQRYVFVDGTGRAGFSVAISQLMEEHRQAVALLGVDGRASIIRSTGEETELGLLDILSSVAAYGRALGGRGTLTLVRAFVPVGVFGATVRSR
jgi:hypothetical protein